MQSSRMRSGYTVDLEGQMGFLEDAKKTKDNLHEILEQKEYNVFDFYYETGLWQAVAKNSGFEQITLAIIVLNVIWMGVDADYNTKPAGQTDIQFIVADQFFAVFFTGELLIRFLAFAEKHNCMKDVWFKFDSFVVALMVMETWILPNVGIHGTGGFSMLRLLRLLRLTRLTRLTRSAPELIVLLKGMGVAVRSVSSVVVLIIIFTYVFAMIFKQQTEGDEELQVMFGTIPDAMMSLLLAGTLCDNIGSAVNLLRERNPMMCAVFVMWVLLSSFMCLNMLIGILCEVVSAVSETEREKNAMAFAKSQFLNVLSQVDTDKNGTIKETEFEAFCMHADVQAPLDALEVDRQNLLELRDVIFSQSEQKIDAAEEDEPDDDTCTLGSFFRPSIAKEKSLKKIRTRELKIGELLEMILDLRASNPAMVSHIVDLRKHLRLNQKETKNILMEMDSAIEDVKAQQSHILTRMDQLMEMLRGKQIVDSSDVVIV